jgi:hypothetical protein
MATKLKVVEQASDIETGPPLPPPDFTPAPTRKQHAGWTAERQRRFIDTLSLTGSVGQAAASAGVSSRSAYRLRNRAGAESFAKAWDAAQTLSATRIVSIIFDRAVNGRAERFYKDGELVMERRIPSDYLLTWLAARLDPLRFGSPLAAARAAATGDPRLAASRDMPGFLAGLNDIAEQDCPCEPADFIDHRTGEMGKDIAPLSDDD